MTSIERNWESQLPYGNVGTESTSRSFIFLLATVVAITMIIKKVKIQIIFSHSFTFRRSSQGDSPSDDRLKVIHLQTTKTYLSRVYSLTTSRGDY